MAKKHLFLLFCVLSVFLFSSCNIFQKTTEVPSAAPPTAITLATEPSAETATAISTLTPTPTNVVAPVPEAIPLPIFRIHMFADGTGWGYNLDQTLFFHTSDGGLNWQNITPENVDFSSLPGAVFSFFLDGNTAWLSLPGIETSRILHTVYGGSTWASFDLETAAGSLHFLDAQNGFLLSRLGVAAGSEYVALYATTDGGATWEVRFAHEPGGMPNSLPSGGNKTGFTFLDLNIGWIAGTEPVDDYVYLFRSTNNGVLWEPVSLFSPVPSDGNMYTAYPPVFIDELNGFLTLYQYAPSGETATLIYVTGDGGVTWGYLAQLPASTGQDFVDTTYAWVWSETQLLRSTEGVPSWKDISSGLPSSAWVLSVDFVDRDRGWMVSAGNPEGDFDQNFLFSTVDGGKTWQLLNAHLSD